MHLNGFYLYTIAAVVIFHSSSNNFCSAVKRVEIQTNDTSTKVSYGNAIKDGYFKFAVTFYRFASLTYDDYFCSGSIITPTKILTLDTCIVVIETIHDDRWFVSTGSWVNTGDSFDHGQDHEIRYVTRMTPVDGRPGKALGLAFLKHAIDSRYGVPIPLATRNYKIGVPTFAGVGDGNWWKWEQLHQFVGYHVYCEDEDWDPEYYRCMTPAAGYGGPCYGDVGAGITNYGDKIDEWNEEPIQLIGVLVQNHVKVLAIGEYDCEDGETDVLAYRLVYNDLSWIENTNH